MKMEDYIVLVAKSWGQLDCEGKLEFWSYQLVVQTVSFRFRPSVVKDCIHAVLKEELANAEYSPEEMPQLTKHLSETVKDKLKEMGFDRYKMVVQVVIGEQRGEGVLTVYSVL
ncbi:tctex1 domain-containing protein [Lynx pardinus]|uniref:Tctex1 domain-containing protein n=1 Tax=Lynx pardinus TaxID=191816 RepID=A0A485NPK5_LYNPA|nr:tctex1 domain-containing protein [Lynx pardinus]